MSDVGHPQVSFVLATHNRCAVAADTLARLTRCGLDRGDYQIVVVDNASEDGTAETLRGRCDVLLPLSVNAGSCAKACGAERARGRYVVFLDDDSSPRPGSIRRMIARFEEEPDLGAAGFVVHLPDGRTEGGALPDVFVGCGVGFRAEALRRAGGLDRSFFMQAEEYDLAFRLVGAGWRVRMFDDLHVDHLKTARARQSERTTYYDVRNNLRVAARYLPSPVYGVYREDWLQRYRWLAERDDHVGAYVRGAWAGLCRSVVERWTYRGRRLVQDALEHFFQWDQVRRRMADLAATGVKRVVFADLGKNIYAYYRAARRAGVAVLAVGDDRFTAPDRRYRGVPVTPVDQAIGLHPEAVVVANSSPVHGTNTLRRLASRVSQPVYHWLGSRESTADHELCSPSFTRPADETGVETEAALPA